MINVYAWPPVGVVGSEWTEESPVQVSRSIVTGADYTSLALRKRRLATLEVSALANGRSGAGYMEMLKRFLEGRHAVRLNSYPINWHLDALNPGARASTPLFWRDGGVDLEWTDGGTELLWYDGTLLTGTTWTDLKGFPRITVYGLPPNTLVARPGEFLTAFADEDDTTGTTVQIVNEVTTNANGEALIRLFSSLGTLTNVRVNIGTSDTGVFKPVQMPRSVQPVGANWTYSWQFREVFSDEVGGFTEVDPWT